MPGRVASASTVSAHLAGLLGSALARTGGFHSPGDAAASRKTGTSGLARALALLHVERRRVDRLPGVGSSALSEAGACHFARQPEGGGTARFLAAAALKEVTGDV